MNPPRGIYQTHYHTASLSNRNEITGTEERARIGRGRARVRRKTEWSSNGGENEEPGVDLSRTGESTRSKKATPSSNQPPRFDSSMRNSFGLLRHRVRDFLSVRVKWLVIVRPSVLWVIGSSTVGTTAHKYLSGEPFHRFRFDSHRR